MPLLFSYGTLQDPAVQQSTFGRVVDAQADELIGFALGVFVVADPAFVAKSGKAEHAIVRRTNQPHHRVRGVALELTDEELTRSDGYEPAGYVRVRAQLASGRDVWVYAADE